MSLLRFQALMYVAAVPKHGDVLNPSSTIRTQCLKGATGGHLRLSPLELFVHYPYLTGSPATEDSDGIDILQVYMDKGEAHIMVFQALAGLDVCLQSALLMNTLPQLICMASL